MSSTSFSNSASAREVSAALNNIHKSKNVSVVKKGERDTKDVGVGSKKGKEYLSVEVMQKMLNRFLSEKKLSPKDLASALDITKKQLDKLLLPEMDDMVLVKKVSLALIRFYCKTNF